MDRWHVLYTKPRHEWRVAEALDARAVEVFVPSLRYHGRRGTLLERAFFPCYVFARLDWEATGALDVQWTPGLSRVVTFDGRPGWLPDEKVAYLRKRLDVLDGDDFLRLKPGEPVRVAHGPFADIEAVFDRHLNGDHRVAVLLRILGRHTRVILDADDVDRLA